MGVQPLKSDVGDDLRRLDRGADGLLALLVKRVGIAAQKRSDRRSPLRSSIDPLVLNRPNLITYRAPVSMAMETTAGDSSPIKLRRRDGPGRKRIPGGARTAAYRSAFAFENGDEENHSTPHA